MGIVSPLGNSVQVFGDRFFAGESGLSPIEGFDPAGLRNEIAGEVKEIPALPAWAPDAGSRHFDALFTLAATDEALADAGLSERDLSAAGCILSTNFACQEAFQSLALDPDHAEESAWLSFGAVTDLLGDALGLHGPTYALSISCASGTAAIGTAADLIRLGRADVMLAGGCDVLALFCLSGLGILRTISPTSIRPFDARRDGTIFGEGAAVVVLEEWQAAGARGARIRAEILGWALNNNAYHLTAPDKQGEGIIACMARAVQDAGVSPEEIDYVNAHGTGTPYHDVTETWAIKAVLGDHAYRVPVSSIKPAIGHTMGAAGTMEFIATVLAMERGAVAPTLNLEQPAEDCDLDYVPGSSRSHKVRIAVSNSAGVGGSNASIVLASPRRSAISP